MGSLSGKIHLIASGASVLDIPISDMLPDDGLLCTTNYPVSLISPLLISDYHFAMGLDCTKYWTEHNNNECKFIGNKTIYDNNSNLPKAFDLIYKHNYYPYNDTTFLIALQWLRRMYANEIVVFGLDFEISGEYIKWYNKYIDEYFTKNTYERRMLNRELGGLDNKMSFKELFEKFYNERKEWLSPISFKGKWKPT